MEVIVDNSIWPTGFSVSSDTTSWPISLELKIMYIDIYVIQNAHYYIKLVRASYFCVILFAIVEFYFLRRDDYISFKEVWIFKWFQIFIGLGLV